MDDRCSFRLTIPAEETERQPTAAKYCALAFRHIDGHHGAAPDDCRVDELICRQCYASGVPDKNRLNPVVASLAFQATERVMSKSIQALDLLEQLTLEQTSEFCKQRLPGGTLVSSAPQPEVEGAQVASLTAANKRKRLLAYFRPRIGLIGRNSPFGLGHQNRDLAERLNVYRWLAPFQPADTFQPALANCQWIPDNPPAEFLAEFVDSIDCLLFVERPVPAHIPAVARARGTPVICVPNWEWIRPTTAWLQDVDLMICPCRTTFDLLSSWKARYGFSWQLAMIPWPIPIERFPFRHRTRCDRFVFIGGSGGCRGYSADLPTVIRRKGLDLILQTAERMPSSRFLVYTSQPTESTPENVEVRGLTSSNVELYAEGDVCVQPSYWEGLGLPLLECQAAGMPLITSDAAPMNEYQPLAVIPVKRRVIVNIGNGQRIVIPDLQVDDMVATLQSWQGKSISDASMKARRFVLEQHSWKQHRRGIKQLIRQCIESKRLANRQRVTAWL